MDKSYKIIWPLILPSEIPEITEKIQSFQKNINDKEKVHPDHARLIKFFRYIVPNITGVTMSTIAVYLLHKSEQIKE